MEKIDVLLATYNGEKYLKEQVDSILNQTYKNINLLISDDGSSDLTVEILKEYEATDSRVKIFIQKNNIGLVKNFEFLLRQVTSEYYMMSDQDDVWLPEKIEKSIKKLMEEDADLVFCDLEVVDKDLKMIFPSFWEYLKIDKKIKKYNDFRMVYLYNCANGCAILSKSKFIEHMLPLPNNSKFMIHDYWIILYVSLHGKISYVDEKLIKYRQHGNNQVGTEKLSTKFSKFEQVRELFLRVKIEHFEDFVARKDAFSDEQNEFNEKALNYFKSLTKKKYINFSGIKIFHKLYKYDRLSYYVIQYVIMNVPLLGNILFKIRYMILKILGKR